MSQAFFGSVKFLEAGVIPGALPRACPGSPFQGDKAFLERGLCRRVPITFSESVTVELGCAAKTHHNPATRKGASSRRTLPG